MGVEQQQIIARWQPHLDAAAAAGLSLHAYARMHGLNRKTLYAARKRAAQAEAAAPKKAAPKRSDRGLLVRSRFAAVRVSAPNSEVAAAQPNAAQGVRAVLPNGIVIECGADTSALSTLLSRLIALAGVGRHVSA
jgi:hypothetical protein